MNFQDDLIETGIGLIHGKLLRAKEDKSLCKDERYMEIYQQGKIRAFQDALSILSSLKKEGIEPHTLAGIIESSAIAAGGEQE